MTNVSLRNILLMLVMFLAVVAVPVYAAVDTRVVSLTSEPATMYVGDSATLKVRVDNTGDEAAVDAVVKYEVINSSSNVVSSGTSTISLGASEVQDLSYSWSPVHSGAYTANANITINSDVNNASNTGTLSFDVSNNVTITNFQVTETVNANELLYSSQSIIFSGKVLKNSAGIVKTVTFTIDGVGIIGSTNSDTNGDFSHTHSTGVQFSAAGETNATATVYEDSNPITVKDTINVVAENASGEGKVNMIVTPYKLKLVPGQLFDYIISLQSIGDTQGTYTLEISTHHEFEYWFSPEINYVTLQAGGQKDISLFVDVPDNAGAGTYSISIKLEDLSGRLIDLEKVYLEIDADAVDADEVDDEDETRADYDVNVNLEPRTLNVKAGNYREFDVSIHNLGKKSDSYTLDLRVGWNIDHWFEFEDSTVSVGAGKTKYISLYVDVPTDAVVDTYPVKLIVDGQSSDVEKADLMVTARDNIYDLSLGTPLLTPSGFYIGAASTVNVAASVELTDLKYGGGRYVYVKLYVDDSYMETKEVYIASGQTKDISFTLDANKAPIHGEAGGHEIYYTASISGEYEKSRAAVLNIKELGEPTVLITPDTFETAQNGTIGMTLQVYNPTFNSQTYLIYAKGLDLALDPESITVLPEETKKIALAGTLNNAPVGNTSVDIYVSNANAEMYDTITLNIAEGDQVIESGEGIGAGLTGYLLTTTGGVLAMIIALFALVAVVGYYYYSKQDEEVLGDEEEDERGFEQSTGPGVPPATGGSVLNKFKKTFIGGAATQAAGSEEAMKRIREGIDLDRFEYATVTEGLPERRPKSAWNSKDAEHVLENLEGIKQNFHSTYNGAKEIKQKLHSISTSMEQKAKEVHKHIESEQKQDSGVPGLRGAEKKVEGGEVEGSEKGDKAENLKTEQISPRKPENPEPAANSQEPQATSQTEEPAASNGYIKSILDNV